MPSVDTKQTVMLKEVFRYRANSDDVTCDRPICAKAIAHGDFTTDKGWDE